MWTDLLIFLPMLLALVAVALVIWFRREGRKDQAGEEQPDQQAQRPIWRPQGQRDDR